MLTLQQISDRLEIGDLLNISEGTSKSQLSRAKVVLQDLVKKFLEERNR